MQRTRCYCCDPRPENKNKKPNKNLQRTRNHNVKKNQLTESQLVEVLSVTFNLMVIRVGAFWETICEMSFSSSSLSLSETSLDDDEEF